MVHYTDRQAIFNPLSTNPTKQSSTLKKFVGKLQTNCLKVFGHFVKLALKGLRCIFKENHFWTPGLSWKGPIK